MGIKKCRYCIGLEHNPDYPGIDEQVYFCYAANQRLTEHDVLGKDKDCVEFKPTDEIQELLDIIEEHCFI